MTSATAPRSASGRMVKREGGRKGRERETDHREERRRATGEVGRGKQTQGPTMDGTRNRQGGGSREEDTEFGSKRVDGHDEGKEIPKRANGELAGNTKRQRAGTAVWVGRRKKKKEGTQQQPRVREQGLPAQRELKAETETAAPASRAPSSKTQLKGRPEREEERGATLTVHSGVVVVGWGLRQQQRGRGGGRREETQGSVACVRRRGVVKGGERLDARERGGRGESTEGSSARETLRNNRSQAEE